MMQPNGGLLDRFQQQDSMTTTTRKENEERFLQAYSQSHSDTSKNVLNLTQDGRLHAGTIDPWISHYSSGKLLSDNNEENWNAVSPTRQNKINNKGDMPRRPLDLHPSPPNSSSISSPEDSQKTHSSYEQHYLRTSPEKDTLSYGLAPNTSLEDYADRATMLRHFQSYGEQPSFILPDSTPEYSIFVGDLSHDLTEEDLVAQFLQPSPWPASHPFAIAHAHAQQSKGFYGSMARFRPAPFLSTKSAKIMKDPVTGISRGFGFVRFSKEEDCSRALVEMQGMVVNPAGGQGRPLRVCTATPKNREGMQASQQLPMMEDPMSLYHQLQLHQHRLSLPTTMSSSSPPRDNTFGSLAPTLADISFAKPLESSEDALNASNNAANNTSAIDPSNTTVFVGGLSSLISEDTLKTFFAPFGEIIYVKIPPGKGCGFVQFVRKIDAERAIERMQGFPIGGGRIRLSWGRSQGDKAAAAAAQAVAQSAQINHLANLAGLGVLTPTQISQLAGASLAANAATAAAAAAAAVSSTPNTVNTDAGSLLRQLAAAISSPTTAHSRERSATMQNLPAMEQQHRQAHQFTQTRQMTDPYMMPWQDNTDYMGRLAPSPPRMASKWNNGMTDQGEDYLSSLLPSLNLGGSNTPNRLQLHESYNQRGPMSPNVPFSPRQVPANETTSRQSISDIQGGIEDRASKLLKQSSIFSPFSPPVSPGPIESKTMTREASPLSIRDQSNNGEKDVNSFNKYLEAQQRRQQDQFQQHLSNQQSK